MNMNDLKSSEPFFGRWFIKDYIGTTSSGSLYLIYCIENGVFEYNTMKVIGVPKDKSELKHLQFHELDYESSVQYYKELVTDLYREICLIENLEDKSHLVSYKEHMIFQRGNGVGYDIFLRMEFLPNFTKELQSSNRSIQDILRLGKDICDALHVCELYHIIHGDLRPDTIFVTENGSFKLGDFSFSRYSKQEEVLLEPVDMVDYMAPEVYQGKLYDNRADIYSLGLIMYQLLNDNKLPYLSAPLHEATTTQRQLARKQRHENQVFPSPAHATEELAKVVAKACDFDPKLRYQSAEEFKDALTAIAVFLDSDFIFQDKDHTLIPTDIYINNEIVETAIGLEPARELHPQVEVSSFQEAVAPPQVEGLLPHPTNKVLAWASSMKPWVFIFLLFVSITSVTLLLSKVEFSFQGRSSSIDAIADNPTILSPTNIVEPSMEPTLQPTMLAQPTAVPDIVTTPVIIDRADLISIVNSGKNLTSLEGVVGLDKAIAIDLSNNQLTKIDGLKEAAYVETLVLNHNQIVNVEVLHMLTKLKALDISDNQITSFIKLRNLENLEILSASNNLITNLNGLEKMTALKILYLNGNSIQDISVLKEITSLEMIDLSNNKVKEKDIKALRKALPECIIIY